MDRRPDGSWWQEARAVAERQARGTRQASDAADDLAQDLAVAALEQGARVQRAGAWLERVGRNARIDRWRVERRRDELAVELEPPAAPADPETRVLARERRGVLRRALAALPRPLRRAALARFHADLPFDAIAARLGTHEVTARTRVHRALARLREGLGGLRVIFVPLQGAHATVLGLTLVAGVARPALFPAEAVTEPPARAAAPVVHVRRVAEAPVAAPVVVPAPSRPEPRRAPKATPPVQPASTPAVQRINYENDRVDGNRPFPWGDVVPGEPPVKHLSLIELRWHFVPEMAKSFEDL